MPKVAVQGGPSLRRSYLFPKWQRVLVGISVGALHLMALFYLIMMCFIYAVLPPNEVRIFGVYNRTVSVVTTLVLGLLHLHGVYIVFKPRSLIKNYDFKLFQWYRFFFGRYGPFGLHGPLYSARMRVKLLCQTPLHMYRAYRMSCFFTTPFTALFSTVLLAVNVSFFPLLLELKNPFARQWLPAILDAVIDFALSTGIPISLVFQSVADYYIHADKDIAANHVWLDRNVLLGRFIAMTSPLEIVISIVFFTTSYISLCTLNFGIRVKEGCVNTNFQANLFIDRHHLTHSRTLSRGLMINSMLTTKSSLVRRIQLVFWCVVISTSLLLVGIAIVFLMGDSCSAACPLYTYPWFIFKCTCIMYILDCDYYPTVDVDNFIQSTLTDVFDLNIVHCAIPNGLTKETMATLSNIYSLSIDRAGIIEWNIESTDMPASLFAIYMSNMNMPQLPKALTKAWPSLEYVFFHNLTFTRDSTLGEWPKLRRLFVTNMNLTSVPGQAFTPTMLQISLDNNEIASIPQELWTLPSLSSISLINNSFTNLPTQSFSNTVQQLYLNGNPIHNIPEDTSLNLLTSYKLILKDTPFCNRLLNLGSNAVNLSKVEKQIVARNLHGICGHECNIGCHASQIGNGQCNPQCQTPVCLYDKGDCISVLS